MSESIGFYYNDIYSIEDVNKQFLKIELRDFDGSLGYVEYSTETPVYKLYDLIKNKFYQDLTKTYQKTKLSIHENNIIDFIPDYESYKKDVLDSVIGSSIYEIFVYNNNTDDFVSIPKNSKQTLNEFMVQNKSYFPKSILFKKYPLFYVVTTKKFMEVTANINRDPNYYKKKPIFSFTNYFCRSR